MMNRKDKILFAKRKLADVWKCDVAAFDSEKNVFIESKDVFFEIITFGENAVIRGDKAIVDWCAEKFGETLARDIMDGDNLYMLDTKLRSMGKKLGGEHIRYLHLFPEKTVKVPSGFTYKWYEGDAVKALYQYRAFDNALNFEQDVIAVAAYDGDKLAAMAGADDYLGDLWQIGIDTMPEYRHLGLGAHLVKALALKIEEKGKVSFYNTWSPNIASTRVALSTGFYPVWMGYPSEDFTP